MHNIYLCFLKINKNVKIIFITTAYYAFHFNIAAIKKISFKKIKFEDYYIFEFNPQNIRIKRL